jgi:hypothetical protein
MAVVHSKLTIQAHIALPRKQYVFTTVGVHFAAAALLLSCVDVDIVQNNKTEITNSVHRA